MTVMKDADIEDVKPILGPEDTDFIRTSFDAVAFANAVAHEALKIQMDAKALVQNEEVHLATFERVGSRLAHFHANELDLGVLKDNFIAGNVDHDQLGLNLHSVQYNGYVTAEQRELSAKFGDGVNHIGGVSWLVRAFQFLREE